MIKLQVGASLDRLGLYTLVETRLQQLGAKRDKHGVWHIKHDRVKLETFFKDLQPYFTMTSPEDGLVICDSRRPGLLHVVSNTTKDGVEFNIGYPRG